MLCFVLPLNLAIFSHCSPYLCLFSLFFLLAVADVFHSARFRMATADGMRTGQTQIPRHLETSAGCSGAL